MRTILLSAIAIVATLPASAWAAGHGGGGTGHGANVSQTAHTARMNGSPVGPSVRPVARSKSQGPAHANANAISHVQNSPGKAASNSVLGDGSTPAVTKSKGKGKSKTRPAR